MSQEASINDGDPLATSAGGSFRPQEALETRDEVYEFPTITTNNITELTAIEMGLGLLAKATDSPLTTSGNYTVPPPRVSRHEWHILTDSEYSIGVLSLGWKRNKNVDLIERICTLQESLQATCGVTVEYHWVPGHAGVVYNERVDKLAKAAAFRAYQRLRSGGRRGGGRGRTGPSALRPPRLSSNAVSVGMRQQADDLGLTTTLGRSKRHRVADIEEDNNDCDPSLEIRSDLGSDDHHHPSSSCGTPGPSKRAKH